MKQILLQLLFLTAFCTADAWAQQQDIYLWLSPEGKVAEIGGIITQSNWQNVPRINSKCSGYYVIALLGTKERIDNEDGAEKSQYMTITLDEGNTFKAGDIITVTAMRNANVDNQENKDPKSNIYFAFDNGATIIDENTWPNLGLLRETVINGGISSSSKAGFGHDASYKATDGGSSSEGYVEYDLTPSSNSFIIPDEADGAHSVRLTRNDSECRLYIVSINVIRNVPTAISHDGYAPRNNDITYDVSGQRTNRTANNAIVIRNGKKYLLK